MADPFAQMTAALSRFDAAVASNLVAPMDAAAQSVERAADRMGRSLSNALGHAARTGEFSIRRMVDAILRDLSRLAVDSFIVQPIRSLMQSVFSGLGGLFGGPRAMGGPVGPGRAYLVGERGPELFVPGQSGRVVPNGRFAGGGGGVTINITTPDAGSFLRAEGQVAAAVQRAVARGNRNL